MRAAGADGDRAGGSQRLSGPVALEKPGGQLSAERRGDAGDHLGDPVFAHPAEGAIQLAGDPAAVAALLGLDIQLLLEMRLELLEHEQRAAVRQERPRFHIREGMRPGYLEEGNALAGEPQAGSSLKALFQVGGGDPGGDDPQPARLAGQASTG